MSSTFIKFEKDFFAIIWELNTYKKIINTFYGDFPPLDNKVELKGLWFQHERNEASIIPIGNVCIFMFYYSASTKPSPKLTKLVSISFSWITLLNYSRINVVVAMVTE